MWKAIPFFIILVLIGCESASQIEERTMAVTDSVTFFPGESTKLISITHNCSCPFRWYGTPATGGDKADSNHVLKAFSGTDDQTMFEVSIIRDSLKWDTYVTRWDITSNGYGVDSIIVTVLR